MFPTRPLSSLLKPLLLSFFNLWKSMNSITIHSSPRARDLGVASAPSIPLPAPSHLILSIPSQRWLFPKSTLSLPSTCLYVAIAPNWSPFELLLAPDSLPLLFLSQTSYHGPQRPSYSTSLTSLPHSPFLFLSLTSPTQTLPGPGGTAQDPMPVNMPALLSGMLSLPLP